MPPAVAPPAPTPAAAQVTVSPAPPPSPTDPPSSPTAPLASAPVDAMVPGPIVQPARVERRWREWPIALVLSCVTISLIVVAANHFRRGSVLLAASVLLATGLRLVLPARQAGLLAVRSRRVAVIALCRLGGGLMVLALVVPPPS